MNPILAMMMFSAVAMKAAKDPLVLWGLKTSAAPAKPAASQDIEGTFGKTGVTP